MGRWLGTSQSLFFALVRFFRLTEGTRFTITLLHNYTNCTPTPPIVHLSNVPAFGDSVLFLGSISYTSFLELGTLSLSGSVLQKIRSRFEHSKTATTRPLTIERALKTDLLYSDIDYN